MPPSKLKKALFYAVLLAGPTLTLLGIGEVLARAFFPEFKNQITNEQYTLGQRLYSSEMLGMRVRVPQPTDRAPRLEKNRVLLVFGDSISGGHGLAYDDIYWARWKRLVSLEYENPPEIVAIVAPGNNFVDNLSQIRKAIEHFEAEHVEIIGLVYQFNFNDIAPYSKQDLLDLKHINTNHQDWWRAVVRFRLNYLNHSVLQRVLSHYMARLISGQSTDCTQRGISALESMTWSYGALPFRTEAERLWKDFETQIHEVKNRAGSIPFYILISPTLYDIDHENIHTETFSKTNLAWNCQTIEPRTRLKKLSSEAQVELVDPTPYIRQRFLARIEEGNPERFFFPSDDNHFNRLASMYFSEFSYFSIVKNVLSRTQPAPR